MKSKRFLLVIAVGVLAVTALSVKRAPQPPLFCDKCVMAREAVVWRLAGRWTLFETASTSVTPVSELLREHSACPPHEHRWAATVQVAEAELETPDAPRVRTVGFLNAPRTVVFLRSLFDYANPADLACWRQVAWQPLFASVMDDSLRFRRFPETGFSSRDEFLAWWRQNSFPLFNRMNEITVAD